ncbi:MAG TPA: type II toxin-antitoxin system HicA family toxin [Phycisphaerae bacterium]|nr:type II toxin-antitoxin system HicA family toxin [Phycisphaerae bacterium]
MPGKPFAEVLKLLESHGWTLQRTWPPYFVFVHPDRELPLLIPVHDRMVADAYVAKIKEILEGE